MEGVVSIPLSIIAELPDDKRLALLDMLIMADENREFHSTVRQLSDRWKWGSKKTFTFLKDLEEGNILETQRKHKGNTLYRINTEFLTIRGNTKETQRKHKGNTKEDEDKEIYKRIIDYLNMICGTNYKHTTVGNQKDIKARLAEKYEEQDFYTVIEKKAKEWKGAEREKYLRPSTLFGNKFGEYLNQKIIIDKPKNQFNNFKQNDYNFDELERELLRNGGNGNE